MKYVLDGTTNVLAEICGWLLLIVMGFITTDLISRALGTPIYGVSESAMFVMIAIVYLGLPYAEKTQTHVRVELVLDRLPTKAAAILDLLVYLLVAGTMILILYAVGLNAQNALASRQAIAGPTPLLIWPVKFVMVAALALYCLQILSTVFGMLRKIGEANPQEQKGQ
ncbi:TRAP transporter small permease subunit [Roseibium denhamense]|uniref:TRAP transporter small permease protein n=1 Tax=Roseibium denhamense TaxID=76305 RepID=A0ABY1ND62_9HYPH|nr:TRAP transporter small permease [Roseibium denhamense]SMP06592.1 TRAP-type C4-dicarboxylate transport system, small permease component [Roseibium denhamense]